MRNKIIFQLALLAGLFVGANFVVKAQLDNRENPKLQYIDLITDGVNFKTLDDTTVKVAIRNLGNKNTGKSVLKFVLTKDGKTITKTVEVSAVKAKDFVWISVSLGENLYLSKYCVTADSTNLIKETKENNNTRCGEFGGKP